MSGDWGQEARNEGRIPEGTKRHEGQGGYDYDLGLAEIGGGGVGHRGILPGFSRPH
jgi:hypothetical protein